MGRLAKALEVAKEYSETSTVHGFSYVFSNSLAKVRGVFGRIKKTVMVFVS